MQQLRSENSQLRERSFYCFFFSSTELKSVMRSMEVSPAPAVASDGASLQSMMSPNEQDAETKAKIRRYIVENSDLRLQMKRV